MITYLYERVSTAEQGESGLGLEAQRARNTMVARMLDRDSASFYLYSDSGISGAVPFATRKSAAMMCRSIDACGESDITVIAYSLDRLSRDVDDGRALLKWFDERGVKVVLSNEGGNTIDTSTAMGRFLLTIRLAQGELERGLTAERTKAALGALRERGGKTGEAPYGWRALGNGEAKHVIDVDEMAVVELMLHLAAKHGVREIARRLNQSGHRTREGREWTHVQVARVLQRAGEEDGE